MFYKDNDRMIDFVEISEMLKAKHMIEGGWISRFSKHSNYQ
ncbi:hypothetical protein [Aquimarina sp. Aq107]|nr:hypothetical protein [Aquimarina sp. Aq107]